MALTITPVIRQVYVGSSTDKGYALGDLRDLGFFEPGEPVSLGSCFLDYRDKINKAPHDPIIGVSTYNVGVPSTGIISPIDLIGAVRELRLDVSGSDIDGFDIAEHEFADEQINNIRKRVAITTSCSITSDTHNTPAVGITTDYKNLRITVSGTILGAGGTGGVTGSKNGTAGGDCINVINGIDFPATIDVTTTGIIRSGGGGGGMGEKGEDGVSVRYKSGSYFNHFRCGKGCSPNPCPGHLTRCYQWDPFADVCECTYTTYKTAAGGTGGAGGDGGNGRGGDNPSASLSGSPGGTGGPDSGHGSTAGKDAGGGGAGGEFGKRGEDGQPAPVSGDGGPGIGGQPGFAFTGGYQLGSAIAGIVTGRIPDPWQIT